MANDDLATALYNLRRRADRAHIYDCVIAKGADSIDDYIQVVIPGFDDGRQRWSVDFWNSREGDYPRRGNPGAVALTNSNQLVLVSWMPGGGGQSKGTRAGGGGAASVKRLGDIASGTPQQIIEDIALPIGTANNLNTSLGQPLTVANVQAANEARSSYDPGSPASDHNGPSNIRWAVDMAMGSEVPTDEMDAAADQLADAFGISWAPSGGGFNRTYRGYRYQLIYRTAATSVYGNHMNHVHLGVRKT